jgi:hypothetical protein
VRLWFILADAEQATSEQSVINRAVVEGHLRIAAIRVWAASSWGDEVLSEKPAIAE